MACDETATSTAVGPVRRLANCYSERVVTRGSTATGLTFALHNGCDDSILICALHAASDITLRCTLSTAICVPCAYSFTDVSVTECIEFIKNTRYMR